MKNMIPEQMQKLWRYGLESDKYSMKLCGAGGGGFLLVFFYEEESIHSIFEKYKTYNVLEI
jgi:mevalonate kinase